MRHAFLLTGFLLINFIMAPPAGAQVKARWIVDDKDAMQSRVDIIEQAKKEILVEYFYVSEDDQSLAGMALVLEAARNGIKVKVILDAMFASLSKSMLAALFQMAEGKNGNSNLEIRIYNPLGFNFTAWDSRDHAKMLIIDNEILMIGGRNVGDSYFGVNKKRNFHDLDILLKGPIAATARANFMSVWNSSIVQNPKLGLFRPTVLTPDFCQGKEAFQQCLLRQEYAQNEINRQQESLKRVIGDILNNDQSDDLVKSNSGYDWFQGAPTLQTVKFISHKPDVLVSRETALLSQDLLQILVSAKSDVNIVSPYLIPTPNIIEAFKSLKARGIPVRIITNSLRSTDNLMAQAGYRTMQKELVELGIEIYEYAGPDTIHAKTALIDRNLILVGTYNMDPRSSFINREVGVALLDKENTGMAAQLESIIENFRTHSVLVAKDGEIKNLQWQQDCLKALTFKERLHLRALMVLMPLIKHKL